MNKYFRSLASLLPPLDKQYIEEAHNARYSVAGVANVEHTRGFDQAEYSSFNNNPLLDQLRSRLNTHVSTAYFRMNPHSYYDWHCDYATSKRGCAINYRLDTTPSLSLFRQRIDKMNYTIIECEYTLYEPMLFNTQEPHAVINHSNDYRHLLTISLGCGYEQAWEAMQNGF